MFPNTRRPIEPVILAALLSALGCRSQRPLPPNAGDEAPVAKVDSGAANDAPPLGKTESPEHAEAKAAGLDAANGQLAQENQTHKWTLGDGTTCDPNDLSRPNSHKHLKEPPGMGGCPVGMAPVFSKRGVCIDRWEASLTQALADGTEQSWSPYMNPGTVRVRARSTPTAIPQAYISQSQAADACAASHKRLCSNDEWLAACQGSAKTPFPYGATEKLGTCNDHRDKHPAQEYMNKEGSSVFAQLQHPCIDQVPDSLLPTGAKAECVTPEGVYDMVGNVHEWTEKGGFRGGYYVDTQQNGHGCNYVTTAHDKGYWDYSTGFRCCAAQ